MVVSVLTARLRQDYRYSIPQTLPSGRLERAAHSIRTFVTTQPLILGSSLNSIVAQTVAITIFYWPRVVEQISRLAHGENLPLMEPAAGHCKIKAALSITTHLE